MDDERDLRDILTEFWIGVVNDGLVEIPDRLKASEMLAKFILGEGKTPVRQRGPKRPPTTEILRLAQLMEVENAKSDGRRKGTKRVSVQ